MLYDCLTVRGHRETYTFWSSVLKLCVCKRTEQLHKLDIMDVHVLKAGVMWLHMNVFETRIVPIGLMHVMANMAVDVELKTYVLCDTVVVG